MRSAGSAPHPLLKNANFFDGWMKKEKAEE